MANDRCKPHKSTPPRSRCCWWQPRYESYKRGLNTKLHLAVDAHGMPVRIIITQGTTADCSKACELIEGIDADFLLADKAYDTDEIIDSATEQGVGVVIPPKRNRKHPRDFDRDLYKLRHLVENAFLYIKSWRGIATRYAKNTKSFLAAIQIRCLIMWLNILWRHHLV